MTQVKRYIGKKVYLTMALVYTSIETSRIGKQEKIRIEILYDGFKQKNVSLKNA
jgi:hypothetical protein